MDGHFRILGIPRGCDEAALKKAYHQKALALHPDRNPTGAEQFKKVNEAYEALRLHFRRNGGRDSTHVQSSTGVGTSNYYFYNSNNNNKNNNNNNNNNGKSNTTYFAFHSYQTNAGSGYQYAKQTHFTEEPPHLFTEEELFGAPPGGFTQEQRNSGKARPFKRSTTTNNNNYNNNNTSSNEENTKNSNINSKMYNNNRSSTSEMYEKANERWRRAHGSRVPVSGYSMNNGGGNTGPQPPPYSNNSQQQQQKEKEKEKEKEEKQQRRATPSPPPYSSTFFTPQAGEGTGINRNNNNNNNNNNNINSRKSPPKQFRRNTNNTRGFSPNGVGVNKKSRRSFIVEDDDSDNDSTEEFGTGFAFTTPSFPQAKDILDEFEMEQTLHEVRKEWERLKRDMDRKIPKKNSNISGSGSCCYSSSSSPNDRTRRGRNIYNNRFNSKGKGEEVEEDYVVHNRSRSNKSKSYHMNNSDSDDDNDDYYYEVKRKQKEAEEELYRSRRRERQRLDESHMRSLLEEKLQLKKVLFTQRYTPDPADVALMSDSEVFILCELLNEIGQRMKNVLEGRMTKGLCSRCTAAPKLQDKNIFICGHRAVCVECAMTSAMCPVCAASRR